MSRTITALYDTRAEAEAACSRLTAANIDADNVYITDQSGSGSYGSSSGSSGGGMMSDSSSGGSSYGSTTSSSANSSYGSSTGSSGSGEEGGGYLSSLKNMFLPDEDRHSYGEGIRRGGALLHANVDDDEVDQAIAILDQTGSVDMDQRESSWRSEGWAGYSPAASSAGSAGANYVSSDTGRDYAASGTTGNEERIQLAEEQLVVGKREVERGGARIRSYVVEKPVTEQVNLREEHVQVERRPVDGTTMQGGNLDNSALFQERTVEMTETAEEAVVAKQARVTEELVVSKTAEERTETISDTVRKTEVDIDEDVDSMSSRGSTLGGSTTDRDRF